MKIKMVDVARHLGVSKATVSLAVNDKPGVNPETKKKILECIELMEKNGGNIPETNADGNVNHDRKLIEVVIINHQKKVVCDPELDLWSEVLATFDTQARKMGYVYGLTYMGDAPEEISAVVRECNLDIVAGVIVFGTEMDESDYDVLKRIQKPLVLYDYDIPDGRYSSVCINNMGTVEKAIMYMLDQGAEDIKYFATGKDIYNFNRRRNAFQNVLISNDRIPNRDDIVSLGNTIPEITERAGIWLSKNKLPDAILLENYQVSIGVAAALRKLGIKVPGQVVLVGIDEVPSYMLSGLSFVQMRVPHADRATIAMELLKKEIDRDWSARLKVYAESDMIYA